MHKTIVIALTLALAAALAGAQNPFIGIYEGVYNAHNRAGLEAAATVVAQGQGVYRVTAQYAAPGGQEVYQVELHGPQMGPRISLYGFAGGAEWRGEVKDDHIRLEHLPGHYGGVFELDKTDEKPPTLAMAPPDGAVVLLAFEEGQTPSLDAWSNKEWKALESGAMEVKPGSGDQHSRQRFGDCTLHLEFWLPNMAGAMWQSRANSGVYFMNRYEVQILDSFGLIQGSGDCGSIYELSLPRVNACLPPERWQTYDISFRAPRLGSDGEVKEPARVTVYQNGVLIQKDVAVEKATPGGKAGPQVERDVLRLQDHGNMLRYRNIWLIEEAGRLPAK